MFPAQSWPWAFGSPRPPGRAGYPGATLCEGDRWGELIFNFFFWLFLFLPNLPNLGQIAGCLHLSHRHTMSHI